MLREDGTMTNQPSQTPAEGTFDDVSRSLKAVIRSSRNLGENSIDFVARELAMAVRLSEQVRDEIFSAELLAESRQSSVPASFRGSAHRAVDVVADLGSIGYVLALRVADSLAGKLDSATTARAR
jgi:hypothetical protein